MKQGIKDVIQEGNTVTVIYPNGEQSQQNFSDAGAAMDYCASFGGPAPVAKKPAPKKPAAKAPAKKPVKKSTKKSH